jgi:hypothetical protein
MRCNKNATRRRVDNSNVKATPTQYRPKVLFVFTTIAFSHELVRDG